MQITITRPDDWHLHLRDGEALASVVAHTAAQFGRAIVMPNLRPPVTTTAMTPALRTNAPFDWRSSVTARRPLLKSSI